LGGGAKASPVSIFIQTIQQKGGVRLLYGGAGLFCASNSLKSGIRFFTFDAAREAFRKRFSGSVSDPIITLSAGCMAGIAESVLVVVPGETVKTRIIEDQRRAGGPQYRGSVDAVRKLLANEGIAGVYRGVTPVTMKQTANAMVRFGTYNFILDLFKGRSATGKASAVNTAVAGGLAGIVTVYCTMPFDSIKTRLQAASKGGVKQTTFSCCKQMIQTEGVKSLWKGTTPRLARLTVRQPTV